MADPPHQLRSDLVDALTAIDLQVLNDTEPPPPGGGCRLTTTSPPQDPGIIVSLQFGAALSDAVGHQGAEHVTDAFNDPLANLLTTIGFTVTRAGHRRSVLVN